MKFLTLALAALCLLARFAPEASAAKPGQAVKVAIRPLGTGGVNHGFRHVGTGGVNHGFRHVRTVFVGNFNTGYNGFPNAYNAGLYGASFGANYSGCDIAPVPPPVPVGSVTTLNAPLMPQADADPGPAYNAGVGGYNTADPGPAYNAGVGGYNTAYLGAPFAYGNTAFVRFFRPFNYYGGNYYGGNFVGNVFYNRRVFFGGHGAGHHGAGVRIR